MSPTLDKKLCSDYPLIFADRNKSERESCMHWGFSCNDGWHPIINTLCHSIQHHIDNPNWVPLKQPFRYLWTKLVWNKILYPLFSKLPSEEYQKYQNFYLPSGPTHKKGDPIPQVVALQVKEKFGLLCFYYKGGDEYIRGLVHMAEAMSAVTCEQCGATDDTVNRNKSGWIQTLCKKCRTPKKPHFGVGKIDFEIDEINRKY